MTSRHAALLWAFVLSLVVGMATLLSPDAAARGGGARGGGGGGARTSVNHAGGGGAARSSGASAANRGAAGANRAAAGGNANRGNANRDTANRGNRTNIDNSQRNTNRNTNIERNTNVNIEGNGGCCDNDWYGGDHPLAAAAAVTATVALTSAAIGSIVYSVPPSCVTTVVNGMTYQQCGSTWYAPQYVGTNVQYVVVNPP